MSIIQNTFSLNFFHSFGSFSQIGKIISSMLSHLEAHSFKVFSVQTKQFARQEEQQRTPTVAIAMATETFHPGRRLVLHLPLSDCDAVTIAVLDSVGEQPDEVSCAAMLVPRGEELSWIYASEGGQWQLLATAAVSRLIVVSRAYNPINGSMCEDEALKTRLRSIVVALAPRVCFRDGPPNVPFVVYSDNVIHRVVVEELFSSRTGFMVVEDVALVIESRSGEGTECEHGRELDRVVYRRRLRFKRMPNLIQTEVALVVPQKMGSVVQAFCGEAMSESRIDHSSLVHKYLPPIVAGLVLAASCIEPCMERGERVRVLTLGVGGGALQMFLQKHLGFYVQAVDVDRVVLDVAHRHFGLENGVNMEVTVGDALRFVDELAMNFKTEDATLNSTSGDASPELRPASAVEAEEVLAQHGLNPSISVDSCEFNARKRDLDNDRVHAIIVDVDEDDPRCGLNSPPSSFLQHKFLTDARTVLHKGGLLAMNVVPNGAKSYNGVVASLLSVFDDVYETVVEGDVNRVVFALSCKGTNVNLDGPLARLVKRFLDVRLISGIQKVSIEV